MKLLTQRHYLKTSLNCRLFNALSSLSSFSVPLSTPSLSPSATSSTATAFFANTGEFHRHLLAVWLLRKCCKSKTEWRELRVKEKNPPFGISILTQESKIPLNRAYCHCLVLVGCFF